MKQIKSETFEGSTQPLALENYFTKQLDEHSGLQFSEKRFSKLLEAYFSLTKLRIISDLIKEALPFLTIVFMVAFTGFVYKEALIYVLPPSGLLTVVLGFKKYIDKKKSNDN